MSNLDLTREWLQTVTRPYTSKERVVSDVLQVLGERRTLAVKTDAFTFDSGLTALLVLLHGTLPITYRGATYHIPINVWIPLDYPRVAPLAFVVPTKEMGVRKGREVDPGGRVREEVVDEWWRSWETKNIDTLLRQLTAIFSAAPPVYAKPPQPASPAQSSRSPASSPAPTTGALSTYTNGNTTPQGQPPPPPTRPLFIPPNAGVQPEVLPQYRPAPTPPPHPYSPQTHSRQTSASYPMSQPPQAAPTPPPHPASPTVPSRPTWQSPQSQFPGSPPAPLIPQRPYHPTPQGGYSPQQPLTSPRPPPIPDSRPSYIPATNGWPPGAMAQPVHPQYGAPIAGPSAQPHSESNGFAAEPFQPLQQRTPQTTGPVDSSLQPALGTRRPIQDLLSSPESSSISLPSTSDQPAGPPPIPPSKPPPPSLLHLHSILLPHLTASLPPLVHSLQSSRSHLHDRQEDLLSGEPAIKDEMARLEAVRKVCDSVGRKMDEAVAKGEERVAELETKGEISVDELVCGISIVHNQLVDLVAEDNAIEDTIYHMTRALDAERVDLDRYLKSIRALAREQYMKRALIERILQGMGQTGW